jgi:hypothetical protein
MNCQTVVAAEYEALQGQLQSVEEDLDWYFNWSEGDLAAPSNYSAMVSAIRVGGSSGLAGHVDGIDDGRLKLATKARMIKRALETLAPVHQRVLHAAFGPFKGELPLLGKAAPVALLTLRAQQAHRDSHTTRSIQEWLLRLVHRVSNSLGDHVADDRAVVQTIAAEATRMLSGSVKAFLDAQGNSSANLQRGRSASR